MKSGYPKIIMKNDEYAQIGNPAGKPFRVLIGDLSPILLSGCYRVISRVLPDHRIERMNLVLAADLLAQIKSQPYDLCLLVLNNILFKSGDEPESRKVKVIELLKDIRASTESPIIAFSSYWDPKEICPLALAAGANVFFPLPYDLEAYKAALEDCLQLKQLQRENVRLKRMLADEMHGLELLKEALSLSIHYPPASGRELRKDETLQAIISAHGKSK